MTDYKAIHGKKIKFLTTDLSTAEGEGEVFYSDTDKDFNYNHFVRVQKAFLGSESAYNYVDIADSIYYDTNEI